MPINAMSACPARHRRASLVTDGGAREAQCRQSRVRRDAHNRAAERASATNGTISSMQGELPASRTCWRIAPSRAGRAADRPCARCWRATCQSGISAYGRRNAEEMNRYLPSALSGRWPSPPRTRRWPTPSCRSRRAGLGGGQTLQRNVLIGRLLRQETAGWSRLPRSSASSAAPSQPADAEPASGGKAGVDRLAEAAVLHRHHRASAEAGDVGMMSDDHHGSAIITRGFHELTDHPRGRWPGSSAPVGSSATTAVRQALGR